MRFVTLYLIIEASFFSSFIFAETVIKKQLTEPGKQEEIQIAIEKLMSFNQMRETLAGAITSNEKITEKTFQSTCMPVGKALKEWAKAKGYHVRQVAEKYRNPSNNPSKQELEILKQLSSSTDRSNSIQKKSLQMGKNGTNLYVQIPVVTACLHCHGSKESRPLFIKSKYPNDLAFGFKPGDLRGIYSVFIPN